jgi:hypothetical protein
MFQKMDCGSMDEFVENLLHEVDEIPLAIMLIGSLLKEGNETSQSLWSHWKKTHTRVVEVGHKTRLSNLDASIHLSVYSPRMQADRDAIDILGMLSLLPDGFPNGSIDNLQNHLPVEIDLQKLLQTLKRVSLVHRDGNPIPNQSCLYMLSPIWHFCQMNIQIPETFRRSLTSFYMEIANKHEDNTSSASHKIVPLELLNMHAVFLQAYKEGKVDDQLLEASIIYTKWSTYVGKPVAEIMEWAMNRKEGSSNMQADCASCLSDIYMYCDKLKEAEVTLCWNFTSASTRTLVHELQLDG